MTYEEWAKEVGILQDSESREAWDYQQNIIDKLDKKLQLYEQGIITPDDPVHGNVKVFSKEEIDEFTDQLIEEGGGD